MRLTSWAPCLGLIILLSSCATTTTNYYPQTISSWHGGNTTTLVNRWGLPNTRVNMSGGNTIYMYRTQSYHYYNIPEPPAVGVNVSSTGRPLLVNPTNPNSRRNPMSLTCMAVFEANPKGFIINTKIYGTGCYGSENFAHVYGNPGVEIGTGD